MKVVVESIHQNGVQINYSRILNITSTVYRTTRIADLQNWFGQQEDRRCYDLILVCLQLVFNTKLFFSSVFYK